MNTTYTTNSKEVNQAIQSHILESVTDNEENYYNTIEGACERLKREFERVANYPHNIKKIPNDQKRFSDYLMGLPFSFHYSFFDIENYLKSLNIRTNSKKEFSADEHQAMYHYLIFKTMNKFCN